MNIRRYVQREGVAQDMATVLVTGGSGFIGTHLCRHLHNLNHHVISLDLHQNEDYPWEIIQADVRDQIEIQGIDAVVHLAAQISVAHSVEYPDETLSINVDGTSSIISAAENASVKRLIFASSAAVYGDAEVMPINESTPLIPQSPYAVSKIVGEELARRSTIESCSMRFFNVYGPDQSAEGGYAAVIPAFKKAIASDLPPVVFGDGTQVRDFIHVSDLVRIIELAITCKSLPTEVNIASGQATSILELLSIFESNNPNMSKPLFEASRAGDIHKSIADVSLMNESFAAGKLISIEEGLS